MAHDLQQRLDAFVSGECSPDAFALELSALCESKPERAWDALSLIDQYYRRGKLCAELYRTISHNIERQVFGIQDTDAIGERSDTPVADMEAAVTVPPIAFKMPQRAASPSESAREVLALHAELLAAHTKVLRYRNRIAILAGFGRYKRSALAKALQDLQVSRAQAQRYRDELRSGERHRSVRALPTEQSNAATPMRERQRPRWQARSSLAVSLAAVVLCVGAAPTHRESLSKISARSISLPIAAALTVTAAPILQAPEPGQITLSNDRYVVFPGGASAEISVRRTGGAAGDTDFVWWAEGSGAKAGEDFVPRAPHRAHMPDGVDSVQLSVPILANPSRRHTEMFYVAIGRVGGGASLGSIRRAAVFIMRAD